MLWAGYTNAHTYYSGVANSSHIAQWKFLLGDPVPKSEKQLWGCIIIQVIYHYLSTQILWVSGKALALLSKG